MNEKPQKQDDPIAQLLLEARQDRELPPGFQTAVWRRIEKAEAERPAPALAWLDGCCEWLLRPKLALAGVAAVILAGVIVGIHEGMTRMNQAARERYLTAVAPRQIR